MKYVNFELWPRGEKSLKDLSVTVNECIQLQDCR